MSDVTMNEEELKAFAKSCVDDVAAHYEKEISGLKQQISSLKQPEITKEEIMQIKDPIERQQLMAQHMDLFR